MKLIRGYATMIHMKKFAQIFFAFVFLFLVTGSLFVFAQDANCSDANGQTGICLTNPSGIATFDDLLKKVTDYLYLIAGPILGIMVIVGGLQMLTAQDNETKFMKGRKTITYAAIGFAVILVADGLVLVVQSFLK